MAAYPEKSNKICSPRQKDDKFASETVDPELFKVITVLSAVLSEVKKLTRLSVEEMRVDKTFLYLFENEKNGLSGYVGREKKAGRITYLIMDKNRITWGEREGFSREECFDKVGVLREAVDITDFAKFISGESEYRLKSNYITIASP